MGANSTTFQSSSPYREQADSPYREPAAKPMLTLAEQAKIDADEKQKLFNRKAHERARKELPKFYEACLKVIKANAAYGLYYCRYNGSGAGFFTRWNSYSKYHLILKLKEDGFDADEFDANYNGAITIRWKE